MSRRLAVASTLAGLAMGVPAVAFAQPEDLRLTWRAPAGCPSQEDVRGATLRSVESARGAKTSALEATADVSEGRGAAPWRVVIRTKRVEPSGERGERVIEASTCQGVADATAVLLALALVPQLSFGGRDDDTTASPPPPPPPQPDGRSEPGPRRRAHAIAVGVGAAADASTLPATALGGSVTLAWTPGVFRIEADGRRWGSQQRDLAGFGSGARFTLTSVGLRGCASLLRRAPFDAGPCAGGDLHFIDATGYGADTNFTPTARFSTVNGGALGRFSVTHWLAVRARVEAIVPLARPSFVVEGEGSIHRPPTLGAAASFGAEVLFL